MTHIYQTLYAATPDVADRIPPGQDVYEFISTHLSREYRAWRRNVMEHAVTGRNRLLALYDTVRTLFDSLSLG